MAAANASFERHRTPGQGDGSLHDHWALSVTFVSSADAASNGLSPLHNGGISSALSDGWRAPPPKAKIKAKPEDLTMAITIVFLLNAVAVLLFPFLNSFIQLNEIQFGAWVALAIHDTASVVGAASSIGELSVEVAATLKVARTIWIVPLVIFAAWLYRSKNEGLGLPLFVIFFLIAALLNSFLQPDEIISGYLKEINRICLLIGLFCIGTQISLENLKTIKIKSIILASSVWAFIVPISLILVQKI